MVRVEKSSPDLLTLPKLLDERAVAEWLNVRPNTLARWRMLKQGPVWLQMGARAIRYRRQDVEDWLERNKQKVAG